MKLGPQLYTAKIANYQLQITNDGAKDSGLRVLKRRGQGGKLAAIAFNAVGSSVVIGIKAHGTKSVPLHKQKQGGTGVPPVTTHGQDAHATSQLEREIAATDAEIDDLVYELYGITEEERKIIEGA